MPPLPIVTPLQEDRVGRWAARPSGVSIPEVADALSVSRWTARRVILRLVKAKRLRRTDERRRRTLIFERAGSGGIVYKATAEEKRKWAGCRNSRARPRSKGKWW